MLHVGNSLSGKEAYIVFALNLLVFGMIKLT